MSEECKHDWKEVYNGIKCTKCDLFYPDNGNYFAPDSEEAACPHCGKDFADFSDLGCEYCDRRHPGFGTLP